jgi:hypothetical protein
MSAIEIATLSISGWIPSLETWTYASSTTFTVTGVDVTAKYSKGTRIKLTQSSTVKYFVVTASSFSTNTTVTITGGADYTLANATISDPYFSYAANPQGYPGWFNYTPTWTSSGTQPAIGNGTIVGRFSMVGPMVAVQASFTMGSTTTYGTGDYSFGLPVSASSALVWYGNYHALDTGSANAATGVFAASGAAYGTPEYHTTWPSGPRSALTPTLPFTWASTDILHYWITYEVA